MTSRRWCVWSPIIDGRRMVVADDMARLDALNAAERKNAAAEKHGARAGYVATPHGEEPDD